MDKKVDKTNMSFNCNHCKKKYSSYKSLWNHTNKFHSNIVSIVNTVNTQNTTEINKTTNTTNNDMTKKYFCKKCSKVFSCRQGRYQHEKRCNVVETNEMIINKLKEENEKLKTQQVSLKESSQNNISDVINNQLINFIVDQAKIIENLKPKICTVEENKDNQIFSTKKELSIININNIIIVSRLEDNYIDAIQLCKAGGKDFYDWYKLDLTKEIINDASIETEISPSQLLDIKKENNYLWIHPDLALQLAQWISPKIALKISKWIRTLFTNSPIDNKLLEDKENEIQLKNKRIQLLEDTFLKKHKRKNYPENVIYIVTTAENKKNRIYIVGKAQVFKNRLSTYNKTAEHEVIYYKQCKSKNSLKTIEKFVLDKLDLYREKANRDRFILPSNENINLFTNIVDECVAIVDNKEVTI
jgi:hypothetical protein